MSMSPAAARRASNVARCSASFSVEVHSEATSDHPFMRIVANPTVPYIAGPQIEKPNDLRVRLR
jgi:hypothetical protein